MIGQLQNNFRKFVSLAALSAAFLVGIGLLMLMMSFSHAWAQGSLKDLSINYNDLRLDKGYSIIYDNPNASAKLNEFKIKFYKDATFVDETLVETFPPNGTIVPYGLTKSVIGFNKAELSIISLYSGNITDFPSSAASIIALNEPTEIKPTEPEPTPTPTEPVNKPPLANDVVFEVETSTETFTWSIADQFSDPDDDIVTVVEISKEGPPISYSLLTDGQLTLTAPFITGTYYFNYNVRDSKGAIGTAQISVTVVLPSSIIDAIGAKMSSLDALKEKLSDAEKQADVNQGHNDELALLLGEIDTSIKLAEGKASVKSRLEDLSHKLDEALAALTHPSQIEDLQTQLSALDQELTALELSSQNDGTDITEFTRSLNALTTQMDLIGPAIEGLQLPIAVTADQMTVWETQHQTLHDKISAGIDWRWPLGALVALLGVASVSVRAQKKHKLVSTNFQSMKRATMPKFNQSDLSKSPQKIPTAPVVVKPRIGIDPRKPQTLPQNPALPINIIKPGTTGNVRIPPSLSNLQLGAVGIGGIRPKMEHGKVFAASSSSKITHQLLNPPTPPQAMPNSKASAQAPAGIDIEDIYKATGRVGGSSLDGAKDNQKSFGTACLITPNHVMTNRHVSDQELYFGDDMWTMKELLMYGGDWGIEFMALEDSDESIFVECDGSEPIILDGLDIAIYRLKEEITNFLPVKLNLIDDEEASETENVIVIGYPDHWYRSEFDNSYNAFEDDPLLAVKRSSEGPLIHDEELPDVYTHDVSGTLPVFYHRATTLGGNSGSPVIDAGSNQIIGIHFQAVDAEVVGITDDDENPGYNLAMPINEIINKLPSEITDLMEMP